MGWEIFMKKVLSFNFDEEYDTTQLICTDKMFAVAAGSFDRQIYQFFCCLNSFYCSWDTEIAIHKTNLQVICQILKDLKIGLRTILISDAKIMIPTIHNALSQSYPVLLRVRNNALFFSENYKKKDFVKNNYLLICGYNTENLTLLLLEQEHLMNDFLIRYNATSKKLIQLQITQKMLVQIWEDSKESGEPFLMYIMIPQRSFTIPNYEYFIEMLLDKFEVSQSRLEVFIDLCTIASISYSMEDNIRNFCGSITVLFSTLEKAFDLSSDNSIYEYYTATKKEYISFRKSLLTRISVEISKKGYLQKDAAESMKEKVKQIDKKLVDMIKVIQMRFCKKK